MIELNVELWECTTCGSTNFCSHCKEETNNNSIKKHHVTRVEKAVEEEIYFSIKFALHDAIDKIFRDNYIKYNTVPREESPAQLFELEKLTIDLACLLKEKIKQNL